ncbi:sugar kinase [Rhodanobacter sp. 115]|nr:sugar kinase [Rhodanobacter sp. 115]
MVSFDLNLRPALWPAGADAHPTLWDALTLADLVKLSAEEFAYLATDGEAAVLERLWQGRTRLLVVTDGDASLRWFAPDAEGELPAYRVPAVDTTAAGDAFVGSLLYRLATQAITPDNLPALVGELPRLHATLRFAAAAGALTVTRPGFVHRDARRRRSPGLHGDSRLNPPRTPQLPAEPLPDFRSADVLRQHIADTMAFYHPHVIDPAGGYFQG